PSEHGADGARMEWGGDKPTVGDTRTGPARAHRPPSTGRSVSLPIAGPLGRDPSAGARMKWSSGRPLRLAQGRSVAAFSF
ncbi:MAG: hypothetical protein JW704_08925, partial [Anaerolineaceae bacterium]|nr:hypothetical protein [Anaerolineaceae bacterium]